MAASANTASRLATCLLITAAALFATTISWTHAMRVEFTTCLSATISTARMPMEAMVVHSAKFNVVIGSQSRFTGAAEITLKTPQHNHKGFISMGGAIDPTYAITTGLGFKFPRS